MKPEDLKHYVGKEYQKLDDKGFALGCLTPIYLLYPDAPRFYFPIGINWADGALNHFKKYCDQIDIKNIQSGDIVLFNIPKGRIHASIYIGNDLIVQCVAEQAMQMNRLTQYSKRINSIFRYRGK